MVDSRSSVRRLDDKFVTWDGSPAPVLAAIRAVDGRCVGASNLATENVCTFKTIGTTRHEIVTYQDYIEVMLVPGDHPRRTERR